MKPALLFFLATCLSCLSAKAQIITASPLLQNTYTNPVIADSYADPSYILADNGYPPYTKDEVFKEILEQAENFKKHAQ